MDRQDRLRKEFKEAVRKTLDGLGANDVEIGDWQGRDRPVTEGGHYKIRLSCRGKSAEEPLSIGKELVEDFLEGQKGGYKWREKIKTFLRRHGWLG